SPLYSLLCERQIANFDAVSRLKRPLHRVAARLQGSPPGTNVAGTDLRLAGYFRSRRRLWKSWRRYRMVGAPPQTACQLRQRVAIALLLVGLLVYLSNDVVNRGRRDMRVGRITRTVSRSRGRLLIAFAHG